MYDELVFYNHFGNGDIFESREFVKEIIKLIPAKHYSYAHGKPKKILLDIPLLGYKQIPNNVLATQPFNVHNNILYYNTWIGRDSKYVLPGIGVTIENLYKMHNDQLSMLCNLQLQKTDLEYIPTIDYSFYNVKAVDLFRQQFSNSWILISNGNVHSCQAENFDFTPTIIDLTIKYSDTIFLITQPINYKAENLFYTGDIIRASDGFDLNEISYLSTFCKGLIGRNSGPHVFSQVLCNWNDPKKKSLSFTYKEIASHSILFNGFPMTKYWSNSTSPALVTKKIEEVFFD